MNSQEVYYILYPTEAKALVHHGHGENFIHINNLKINY